MLEFIACFIECGSTFFLVERNFVLYTTANTQNVYCKTFAQNVYFEKSKRKTKEINQKKTSPEKNVCLKSYFRRSRLDSDHMTNLIN